MSGRFLLVGTLATAIALFAWQSVSNTLLPWHDATMRAFPDPGHVQAMRALAPENGVYMSEYGVFAAVAIEPDMSDRTALMGGMLVRQFLLDIVVAFLFALIVLRLVTPGVAATAAALAAAGLAFGGISYVANWIWYGFALPFSLVNTLDLAMNGAVAGAVLALLRRRLAPGSVATEGGVRAMGDLPNAAPRSGVSV